MRSPPIPKQKKPNERRMFKAKLDAEGWLVVFRGARVVRSDKDGKEINRFDDEVSSLFANIGDKLILVPSDVDGLIISVSVVGVVECEHRKQTYLVSSSPWSGECWVMSTHGLRRKARK